MSARFLPRSGDGSEHGSEDFREQYVTAAPPRGAHTFADYDVFAARDLCERKTHVIIREDPMFGRRGWAKEVLPDPAATDGYLVLVVVFSTTRNLRGEWQELMRPGDHGRRYWDPSKLELTR